MSPGASPLDGAVRSANGCTRARFGRMRSRRADRGKKSLRPPQALADGIYLIAELLERDHTQDGAVTRASEDDVCRRHPPPEREIRNAHVPPDCSPVCELEPLALLGLDPQRVKHPPGHDAVVGAGVHQQRQRLGPPAYASGNPDLDIRGSHAPAVLLAAHGCSVYMYVSRREFLLRRVAASPPTRRFQG